MLLGQVGCEACNWGLKRLIKEERPHRMLLTHFFAYTLVDEGVFLLGIGGNGYGMPSSHAQFVFFFSTYLSLFLLLRHSPHPTRTHTPSPFIERLLLAVLAMICASAVAASRVYLNYHTPRQVLIGCYAGMTLAIAWFVVTAVLRWMGWVDWGLDTRIARAFRLRDLVIEEDVADAGWARWQALRRKER
jgi:dolichyldiphosphatase